MQWATILVYKICTLNQPIIFHNVVIYRNIIQDNSVKFRNFNTVSFNTTFNPVKFTKIHDFIDKVHFTIFLLLKKIPMFLKYIHYIFGSRCRDRHFLILKNKCAFLSEFKHKRVCFTVLAMPHIAVCRSFKSDRKVHLKI